MDLINIIDIDLIQNYTINCCGILDSIVLLLINKKFNIKIRSTKYHNLISNLKEYYEMSIAYLISLKQTFEQSKSDVGKLLPDSEKIIVVNNLHTSYSKFIITHQDSHIELKPNSFVLCKIASETQRRKLLNDIFPKTKKILKNFGIY